MNVPLTQEEIDQLLQSKSVSDRSKAMRHYEHFGIIADIPFLIQNAASDASVAVRNNAADAIADILSRYRTTPSKKELSTEERHRLLPLFRRIKVQKTPAVNLAYASLGTSRALSILLSSFVDPRVEMQNCAAAGLRCFCLSQDAMLDDSIEDRLLKLLQSGSLDIPGIAHIVRLCAEAGYQKIVPLLDDLPDLGNLDEIVAATRLQMRIAKERPIGLWYTDGLDALEFNPLAEHGEKFLLVTEDSALISEDGVWREIPEILSGPTRRLFFRPIGSAESVQAIQTPSSTWTAAQSADVQILLQQETQFDQPSNPHLLKVVQWLESRLKDNQKNTRSLAILYMRAESWDVCAQYVDKAMSYKTIAPDIWFVDAKRQWALGNVKDSLESIDKCLVSMKTERSLLARQCQELKAIIEQH